MAEQPTGTITLFFSDVEGSTRLLDRVGPQEFREMMTIHDRVMRQAFSRHGGYEVDNEGDAFFVAFAAAGAAVAAAEDAQRALAALEWPEGQTVRVRIGLHTGNPLPAPPKYVGLDVHKAARIMAAAHGGQVLVSDATRTALDGRSDVVALGEHRLKDLLQPEPLWQLTVDGLESEFPPIKTLGNRPTNLPGQQTPLIGRAQELTEVTRLFAKDAARLVTLTGPGGTGKTRLALQAGAELLELFPAGVFFVSLAPVRDSELVLPTVAQTLAVRELPGEPLADTLAAYLARKELLLVLDNFEQVIDAGRAIVELLARCSAVRALVTSRERLGVRGERVCRVQPLGEDDAVELFVARAAAIGAPVLDDRNRAATVELCARLDHLPLAIELAAARTPTLDPVALLQRLDRPLELLTGGARDADERQRTLRATIAWSYALVEPGEQAVFTRLFVFDGGGRLDAIEAVTDNHHGDAALLDVISSLVDKNLLQRSNDSDGEPRFWLFETIREYAAERADELGVRAETCRRHAFHFHRRAVEAEHRLRGSEQADALAELQADIGNLRRALHLFESAGETAHVLEMATGLHRFWGIRGQWTDARRWLRPTRDWMTVAPELRSDAYKNSAEVAFRSGDIASATAYAEEALRLRPDRSDLKRHGALQVLAEVAVDHGDLERALELKNEALDVAREAGDAWRTLMGLVNGADLLLVMHRWPEAEAYAQEALALEAASDDYGRAGALYALAVARFRLDRPDEAVSALIEEAEIDKRLHDPEGMAAVLQLFAAISVDRGRPELAARLVAAADAALEAVGRSAAHLERELREETVARLVVQLDEHQLSDASNEGRSLAAEAAIDVALSAFSG